VSCIAKTVGLPTAMASRLILNEKISGRGVLAPLKKEIYEPILKELATHNIVVKEEWE
jgi:saccharopine dehydrogenase-like NADP-dependent oxidoreductase